MALFKADESKRQLKLMDEASSYDNWRLAALLHDESTGMDEWRQQEETDLYDHASIRTRLDNLRALRKAGDDQGLLFTLNEGIHGNMGGIAKPALYTQSKFGTKQLIDDYMQEITDALDYLATADLDGISFEDKLHFFRRASHCYGRSALMLSGGAMLGFFHLGVVKALIEQELLPNIISGASAGSLVTAVLGTHTNDELHQFFDPAHLVIEAQSEATWLRRMLWGKKGQINVEDLIATLERVVPDLTFQQAYELTGRRINISVAPAEEHQTSRLLNATTSPNVLIRSAVLASCAVPGVFPPVVLQALNAKGKRQAYLPSRRWIDGSLSEDLPVKRLARLYGVNHYIASQTNPLVLMLVQDPNEHSMGSYLWQLGESTLKEWTRLGHRISQRYTGDWKRFNLATNTIASLITQEFTADVNIIPRYRRFNPRKLFSPLNEQELMYLIVEGEKATWPNIEMIRNASQVSRKLDEILYFYEHEALQRLDGKKPKARRKRKAA